jgi:BirA family biotin operon repressor/biotin-[acetyl-CoA-carboxylase] ligase
VGSPWTDLDRPPLSQPRLRSALRDDPLWRDIHVVATTDSTNADVAAAAAAGAAEGLVVIAEHQAGGRGRLDRRWEGPPRAGVLMSVLLRPQPVTPTRWPTLSLLAGVAVCDALTAVAGVVPSLKWPNDLLLDDGKLGGILGERVGDAIVVGIGLNVSTRAIELPTPTATSLALHGGSTDREPLVKELLRSLGRRYARWRADGGRPETFLPDYRRACTTIGHAVAVELPDGRRVLGDAVDVDNDGRLVLRRDGDVIEAFAVGEVVHAGHAGPYAPPSAPDARP